MEENAVTDSAKYSLDTFAIQILLQLQIHAVYFLDPKVKPPIAGRRAMVMSFFLTVQRHLSVAQLLQIDASELSSFFSLLKQLPLPLRPRLWPVFPVSKHPLVLDNL